MMAEFLTNHQPKFLVYLPGLLDVQAGAICYALDVIPTKYLFCYRAFNPDTCFFLPFSRIAFMGVTVPNTVEVELNTKFFSQVSDGVVGKVLPFFEFFTARK